MGRLAKALRWAELAAVALLAMLCVVGAFLGPERARAMFNSPPLGAFWMLALLGAAGRSVRKVRTGEGVALLGAVLVLGGGLWGSDAGHRLIGRLVGQERPAEGYMLLPEGQSHDDLFDRDFGHRIGRLPFQLALQEFHIGVDEATGAAREYVARVTVFEDGREAREAAIEMNGPLHWGGYHFSLQSGDFATRQYVILRARSDAGLWAVRAGMALLCGGVFWLCWLVPAVRGREGLHGD